MDILENAQATAVIAAAETLPFMAERRVVLCRAMPKDDDAARLAAYAEKVPESTVLLFYIKGKADGRSAFVKAMARLGRSVDFAPLNEIEARRYVQKRAKAIDAPITEQEAAFFVSLAGTDCAALYNELDKAAAYAGAGNEITREVIAKIVTRDLDYVVFEVLDQFIANRATDGLRTLNGLMENGEKPLMIAERLRDKAKLTLQARQLIDKRIGKDAPPWRKLGLCMARERQRKAAFNRAGGCADGCGGSAQPRDNNAADGSGKGRGCVDTRAYAACAQINTIPLDRGF